MLSNSDASDRVKNTAPILLDGGTIGRSGAGTVSEGAGRTRNGGTFAGTSTVGLGALTLSSTSTLDFNLLNTGGVGTLTFASFTSTNNAVLNIINYTSNANASANLSGIEGTDHRLIFNADQVNNLQYFTLNGELVGQVDLGSGFFEITPIPEPSTWVTAMFAFGTLGYMTRRRIARLVSRAA